MPHEESGNAANLLSKLKSASPPLNPRACPPRSTNHMSWVSVYRVAMGAHACGP